ncbi:putative outer membrane starch-binding protein [Breznakibacter xylanolyticus]|uniref:Putative outer membrane starch-binding protein n=1 Tax=Breznakibacter xylanolyticus TaxID=990 RepID=A0A2W7NFB8_9BACT|nr:RagB/SusD family nutrient uptake outer membrane protein [Breznakibacter xylanolyticus]PZX18610.1 putative outer membrane starch-binding protein [Breznakibacter xylanolyticus]
MKINKTIFAMAAAATLTMTGCNEDFLEIKPNDRLTLENYFTSESELQAATSALYGKVWFDFNDKFYYALGDGRANNMFAPYSDYIYPFTNFTETSLTGPLVSAWASLYNVVGQSNNTINNINRLATGVTEESKNTAIAEARFMRGTAYWYLASLWGNVIIIEDNSTLVNNPIVNTHPQKDVFEFAIRDLEFAAKHLPATASQAGRLTKWSAYGMLSRVYLSYAGISDNTDRNDGVRDVTYLELARKAAQKVCEESELTLNKDYAHLFTIAGNNDPESLFALQWVGGTTEYGITNTQQAYFAWNSEITGNDAAWGYFTYASWDMIQEYDTQDTKRLHATFCTYGAKYPELNKAAGGYTYEATDRCNIRKGVSGSTKDTEGVSARMNSGLTTKMLRLAEVYLNYAEAIMGNNTSTSDANALKYYNEVRKRAGMETKSTITYDDLRYERRIELAMEGQYWYDLVRRGYYRQQEVLNYMNDTQERSVGYKWESNQYVIGNKNTAQQVATATAASLLLPYPESEMVQNPLLKQTPVAYKFTEAPINLFE